MSYSLKKIFQIVIKSKPQKNSFLFYDKKERMFCTAYWCYEVEEQKLKLSELKPVFEKYRNSKYYDEITEDIKKNGFNYDKGYIIVRDLKQKNTIINGNHRYLILKKLFGLNHEVISLKITKNYNMWFHILFILFVVEPLKLIYKILQLPKTLIISSLIFFNNIKRKISWTFQKN